MKLSAFCAGRKNSNTEVYVKEALMAAEAKGVEVALYRLNEFELHNCTLCGPGQCPAIMNYQACPHQDDMVFLMDEFLKADGVIIAGSVYSLTGNSLFFTFRDRVFGPKMDVAMSTMGIPMNPFFEGRMKARPGGLISVGGALTENWTSLGLPSLFSATFSAQTEVVDHLNVYGIADYGAATLNEEFLSKAKALGEHVADAMLSGDFSWRGGDKGVCPQCHLSLLQLEPGTDKVMCPVCGIYGTIKAENGKSEIVWPEGVEYRRDNRLTIDGKKVHLMEIMECVQAYKPREEEAKEKMKKYTSYDPTVKSPCKEKKKAAILEAVNAKKKPAES